MANKLKEKYKKIAVLYHTPDEGRTAEETVGHIVTYAKDISEDVDFFLTPEDEFPKEQSLAAYDLIFIAGGPGKVFGDDIPQWMVKEIAMVTDAYHRKQMIVGICLGAQMLALIMGAEVKRNDSFECGFFPVKFNIDEGNPILKDIPASETFWHWHLYGFHTPLDAIEIAESDASKQEDHGEMGHGSQGFVNEHVLALQFHPESTLKAIDFVTQFMDDTEGKFQQSKSLVKMLAPIYVTDLDDQSENCARSVFFRLLDNFLLQ